MVERFLKAQESIYDQALFEIKNGKKNSHWMWFVFPQLKGLGRSALANYYGIENLVEAKEYMANPVLRARLIEISTALLQIENRTAKQIMGNIDDKKLKSCMTLFALATPDEDVFNKVLDYYFAGKMDQRTIGLLEKIKEL